MIRFSRDGAYFLQGTTDNQLFLFQTSNSQLKTKFQDTRRKYGQFTCVTYIFDRSDEDSNSFVGGLGYALIGTSKGVVLMYNFNTAKLSSFAKHLHRKRAVSCVIATTDNKFYFTSCEDDEFITKLDENGSVLQTIQVREGITSLLVVGNFLIVGGNDIRVFDVESCSLICRFMGHTTPITSMISLNLPVRNDSIYLATIAEEDLLVHVWEVKEETSTEVISTPAMTLSCPDTPTFLTSASTKKGTRILVVDEASNTYAFDVTDGEKDYFEPSFNVNEMANAGFKYKACFVPNETKLVAAGSDGLAWGFQTIPTQTFGKQSETVGSKKRKKENPTPQKANGKSTELESKIKAKQFEANEKVKVIFAEEHEEIKLAPSKRRRLQEEIFLVSSKSSVPVTSGLIRHNSDSEAKDDDSSHPQSSESQAIVIGSSGVLTLLKQGLVNDDPKMLALCLDQSSDLSVEVTLKSLSEHIGVEDTIQLKKKLICLLVKTYLAKPGKGENVLIWLRLALKLFGNKVGADEEVRKSLSRMIAATKVRLKGRESLMRVTGKVNYCVDSLMESTGTVKKKKGTTKPLLVYKEE